MLGLYEVSVFGTSGKILCQRILLNENEANNLSVNARLLENVVTEDDTKQYVLADPPG